MVPSCPCSASGLPPSFSPGTVGCDAAGGKTASLRLLGALKLVIGFGETFLDAADDGVDTLFLAFSAEDSGFDAASAGFTVLVCRDMHESCR